jgi:hypothetical protein
MGNWALLNPASANNCTRKESTTASPNRKEIGQSKLSLTTVNTTVLLAKLSLTIVLLSSARLYKSKLSKYFVYLIQTSINLVLTYTDYSSINGPLDKFEHLCYNESISF